LEASQTHTIWYAAIATEVGKFFASDRSKFQSSLTAAQVSLSLAEHRMEDMEASIVVYKEESRKYQEELKSAREECQTFSEKCSQLEEEKNSRELEHGQKIKELEHNAYDCYEDGFNNATQQALMFYPHIDFSHVDSSTLVNGGWLVDPDAEEPFGTVTGPL
jgi:chromosome segregation ATPase